MKPGIYFKGLRSDDTAVELKVDLFDGDSPFSNKVYVGHQAVKDLIAELNVFRHFHEHSKIHITVKAQSGFEEFGMKNVASQATLYLISEPVLLDSFIAELKSLSAGSRAEAKLETS